MRFLWLAVLTIAAGCSDERCTSESCIRAEILEASYCTVADDCVSAGSVCPFGCDIRVNRDELDRIRSLLEGFESRCDYDCAATTAVTCENNTCVAQ